MLEIRNKKFDIRLDVAMVNDRTKNESGESEARPSLDIRLTCKNPFDKTESSESR